MGEALFSSVAEANVAPRNNTKSSVRSMLREVEICSKKIRPKRNYRGGSLERIELKNTTRAHYKVLLLVGIVG